MSEVIVLNPKRKSRKARKSRSRRRGRARARAPRRNPSPFRSSHRRRGRRRHHRNPGLGAIDRFSVAGIPVGHVALGAAGGLAAVMAVNAVSSRLPEQFQSGIGKLGAKIAAVALAAMFLPKVLGRKTAMPLVLGAGTVVAVDGVREFIAPKVPGLSDLMDSPFEEIQGFVDDGVSGFIQDGGGAAMSGGVNPFKAVWDPAA